MGITRIIKLFLSITLLWLVIGCLILLPAKNGMAQNAEEEEYTLSITTRVLESISLFTLENIVLADLQPSQRQITIDPTTDPQAGLMKATGRPDTQVRISFIGEQRLIHHEQEASAVFEYRISGNDVNQQLTSELVEENTYEFRFNDHGEYYFWIGGSAMIDNLPGGRYSGEFVVEVEYL